jgi:hypothetical protein
MHANKHTYAKRQLVLLVVSLAVLIVVLISVIRHKGSLEPQPVPEEPKPVIEELSKCYITENDGKTLTILSGDGVFRLAVIRCQAADRSRISH